MMLDSHHCLALAYLLSRAYLVSVFQAIEAEVTLEPSSTNIAENSPLTLTCSYSGSLTVGTYTMRVSSSIAAAGSLSADCSVFAQQPDASLYEYTCPTNRQLAWTIKKVTRANEGDTWRCLVGFTTTGSEEATFTINVQVPIQSVTMTSPTGSVVTVQENTETVFVCRTSGGLPAATVQWYKDQRTPAKSDDVEITEYVIATSSKNSDDLINVTSTLRYSPGKGDNRVKIYCTGKNSANTLSSEHKPQLDVQYSPDGPPTIVGFNNSDIYSIIENSPGLLSCSVKGGNPLATLSWYCYNTGLAAETVGTTVTKAVTFTASRDQNRNCTCQSSHQVAGTQSVTVSVQVLYPPEIPRFKVKGSTVPGPISFIENKTRSVVCESKGNPNPDTYIWTQGGSTIRNGNTLTFSTVQKKDSGQYTCKAENTMIPSTGVRQTGTNRSTVHISVLFFPTTPSLHYGNVDGQAIIKNYIDVVRGDTFTVACKSEGQPEPTYRWSGQASDNQILSVTSINDNLSRTCTATNTMRDTNGIKQQGSSTSTLTINVLYPPSINDCKLSYTATSPEIVTDSIDVIKGSSFTITCIANGKPTANLSWTGPVTSSSAALTVKNISKQQNGNYTVIAKNTMVRSFGEPKTGSDTKTIHFNILYAPEVQELKTKDVVSGSHLNISCPVVKGNPPAMTFKWTRNDDIMEWNQQILYIGTINKLDDKIYTCAVQNIMNPTGAEQQYGKDSGSFHLNVLYKASVTSFGVQGSEEPASVTVSENDNVTFVCTVDSNPDSNIEIKFQGKTLHKQENTNTLTFIHNNAACLDAGVYTCTAKNQYNNGEVSLKELTLYVRCKPRPLVPVKENVTSALRVSATLNFTGLAYPIPDQFTWEKEEVTGWITLSNSFAILISTSGVDTYLTIKNVSQSDYVKYQLVVQNEVGSYNQTFQLIPEGVPETPKEFKTLEGYIMDRSVILQWKPGFSGGPEQTFVLMYKRTSEQTWRNVTVKDTKDKTMNYTLNQLVSGSQYQAVIFARNRVGDSMSSRNTTFSTTEDVKEAGKSALIGGVAGGSSALIVIIIVIVVVVLQRRGFILKGKAHAREDSDDRKQVYTDENDYGMQDNPMYVSAGPRSHEQRPEGSGSGDASAVYSTVDKNRSVVGSRKNDVYAEVDKSKKTKANKDLTDNEYATAVKPKGKKEKKEKSKEGFKKDRKNKKVMQEGDLYANATAAELEDTLAKQSKNDETIYENPEPTKPAAKKNVNKDGLIYADLTFNDQPKGQKKLVIHGLDSMTEYVQVDFTKKADPLPDSDDENNQPKK